MKKNISRIISFLALFFSLTAFSIQVPPKPQPAKLVNDLAGILSGEEVNQLEAKLSNFAAKTGTQIAVVTINDLGGYEPAEFAFGIGEQWGVGQKGFNNGIVILIKPTGGKGQRKTFIATGYGLEGIVPDAIAKRIVEQEMIPQFKLGNFYGGIDAASTVLMQLAVQEFTPEQYAGNRKKKGGPVWPILLFPLILIVLSIVFTARAGKKVKHLGRSNADWWTLLWLMNETGKSHKGSWGSFRGGSGGGGGFGGFGGGSFGGGGAGGSW